MKDDNKRLRDYYRGYADALNASEKRESDLLRTISELMREQKRLLEMARKLQRLN